jgi:aryl-phospho-beta-D-glucosidase BglC (GH1 family)
MKNKNTPANVRLYLPTLVAAMLLTHSILVSAVPNLINNSDFEVSGLSGWSSPKSTTILRQDSQAAYNGISGMKVSAAYNWCPYGAIYNLDTTRITKDLYEFGARIKLANNAGTFANLKMGLIKNNNATNPIWLDGEQSSYDGGAYPDRWTRLYGVYKDTLLPTDKLQLCLIGGINQPFYVDNIFASPLTPAAVGYTIPNSVDQNTQIHVNGNKLVQGTNKTPYILKGVNLYLYDNGYAVGKGNALVNFKYKCADENAYKEISAAGFNTVRLNMSYLLFEDDTAPGVYKPEGWAIIDRQLAWAKKYNLHLILDMHEAPGGYQSASGFKNFATRADLKSRLENLWQAIARRYSNDNTIIAYDLINEPYYLNWFAYAQTLVNRIRSVDAYHTIIVEESFNPKDPGMYQLTDNNILYDIHFYSPTKFSSVASDTTTYSNDVAWFKKTLRDYLPASFYNASNDTFNVAINIGEYGVVHEKFEKNLGAQQWMRDITTAFNYYGINRELFAYNELRFGIYQGWNTYAGEDTITTQGLKDILPEINK